MKDEEITIKKASELLGVSTWAIRRMYQNGMVPHVRRSRAGYLVFGPEQIEIFRVLIDLKKVGMPQKNLKRLAGLIRQGDETLAEQKAMLETQKRNFWQELEDMQHGIDVIERQVEVIEQKMGIGKS